MTRRSLALAPLFLFAAVLATGCGSRPTRPKDDTGPPVVTVAHPLVDKITIFTDLTGTVDSKEYVDVYPRVSGYIKEIKFKEGAEVKKDDVLVIIDPVIYEAQLGEAEGQVKNYEAQVAKAAADLARTKETYDRGATSKTDLDSAVAAKAVAEAQLYTAKQSVVEAKQNLEWTKVTAPISGRIGKADLTKGNLARADNSRLCNIVSVDPMVAYFDVDEATVRMYMKLIAEKKVRSVDDDGEEKISAEIQLEGETGYPHKGYLEFVDNRLNPQTGSLTIRGQFENKLIPGTVSSRPLTSGLYCRGRVPVGKPFDGLLIPASAVVHDQGKKIVYVLGAENRIDARSVTLGPLVHGMQLVQSGLTKDDFVAIRGLARAVPGGVVQPNVETLPPLPKEK